MSDNTLDLAVTEPREPGLLPPDQAAALDRETAGWPERALSAVELSDLELRLSLPAVDLGPYRLPVSDGEVGQRLALRDGEGVLLATLEVAALADGIAEGDLTGVRLPAHPDAAALRRTPAQLHEAIASRGWRTVHTVLTDRPLFDADLDRLTTALEQGADGVVVALLAGGVEATDAEHHTRLAALRAGLAALPTDGSTLR